MHALGWSPMISNVAGFRVLADEYFLGVEAIRGRQANSLATTIGE